MELQTTIRQKMIDFLLKLPNLHNDSDSQRAFIFTIGLDAELQALIPYGKPLIEFIPLLISTLIDYGTLQDGRNPVIAVLETAKNYIGQDKKEYCDSLIK